MLFCCCCCCFTIVWNFRSTIKRTFVSNTIYPKFFVSIERREKKMTRNRERGKKGGRECSSSSSKKITAKQKIVCNYFVDKLHVYVVYVFFTFHTCFRKQGEGGFQRDFFNATLNRKKVRRLYSKNGRKIRTATHMEKRPRLVCNFRKIKL